MPESTVTEYLAGIAPEADRAALQRVIDIAREVAPDVTEGMSYGMPTLLYRGKGYAAAMQTKAHLALYPFSGSVLPAFDDELADFSHSISALRFSAEQPVPADLLGRILQLRKAQIDEQLDRKR
ncbi:iron chaperone [Microterricola pindariensis]|uniref:YdhG-like domain-containing protein n=1 Tax=Microterricola pindariensis TaxID=478010 RepID=A0ABX5AZS2_9MICO|nr:DUF1801 domain-containing protein [Microterricola pindariensis]PPL20430.1 hypothetical protein GY24_01285 [Microterricola pindariensis]